MPIEFHPNKRRTMLIDHSRGLWKWNHRFHTLFVAASIIQLLVTSSSTSMEVILACVGVSIQISSTIFIHEEENKFTETAQLCNAIFQFDNLYPSSRKSPRTLKDMGNFIMLYCMLVSTNILPIGYVYGLHLINPCKVSLVGNQLIPECNKSPANSNLIDITVKGIVMLLNHWLWLTTICSGTFIVSVVCTMSVSSIQKFIGRLA